ncbi:hypothetical protein ABK040_010716 [Willaertia magna]
MKSNSTSKKNGGSKKSKSKQGKGSGLSMGLNSNGSNLSSISEHVFLDNFIQSIDFLPIDMKRDMGLIRNLDHQCNKLIEETKEYLTNNKKARKIEKEEFIKEKMNQAVDLSEEKCQISNRCFDQIDQCIERIDEELLKFSEIIQQQKKRNHQNTLKPIIVPPLLTLPEEEEDNSLTPITPYSSSSSSFKYPSSPSSQQTSTLPSSNNLNPVGFLSSNSNGNASSSSSSNSRARRLVQHSENVKRLKNTALYANPEKEQHAHIFNHNPEDEEGEKVVTATNSSSSSRSSGSHKRRGEELKEKQSSSSEKNTTVDSTTLVAMRTSNKDYSSLTPLSTLNQQQQSNTVNNLPTLSVELKQHKRKSPSLPSPQSVINSITIPKHSNARQRQFTTRTGSPQVGNNSNGRKDETTIQTSPNVVASSSNKKTSSASSLNNDNLQKRTAAESGLGTTKQRRKKVQRKASTSSQDTTSSVTKGSATSTSTTTTAEDIAQQQPSEELYCFCQKGSFGPMVFCENENCKYKWFHFDCVGLKEEPPEDEPWYCRECIKKMQQKKKKR